MAKAVASISALATLAGGMALGAVAAPAAYAANAPTTSYDRTLGNPTFESAREANGLAKEMNYGAILHAWMWSANTIKAHMDEIADAGYTSIQTVPMSTIKGPEHGMKFTENWYYVYQPSGTGIGNKVIGTEAEIKAMTEEAHKHGIRVIADAVINHFTADWNAIQGEWKDSSRFHTRSEGGCGDNGTAINYNNRWQVTHCHLLNLWDLNTENQTVANGMKDYLVRAVADGVDGFRYDAAKHIELPDEFQTHSPYYDTILPNGAQYQYGEVLQGDPGLNAPAYPALFNKYSTNGGGNTGSKYGGLMRAVVQDKNLDAGRVGSLQGDGVRDNQLVTWVESHDTYANTNEYSSQLSAWQIRMGWGIVGSRAGGAPLFFNRPVGSGGSNPRFAERSSLGDAGDDEWKHPEVKWVNKFRNAMEGNAEYLRNCQGNNCLMIERYKTDGNSNNDGVTVVNMDGDKNLAGMDTVLDDGEYVDQVYGGKLTVSGKKITSGSVKSGKVHVFFNASNTPRASLSVTGAKSFKTDTTQVTLNARNVNNARYTTSEGDSGSFTDGQKITIGAKSAVNTQITVKLTGTDADGNQVTASETFTKKDPNAVVSYTAYAKKPAAWNKIYAYVYVDNNAAAGNVIQNAAWPGELMTAESGACDGTADQVYEIPEDIIDQAGDDPIRVIFNNGGAGEIAGNKFPGDSATEDPDDHVDAAGLLIDGSYVWDGNITSGTWEEASCLAVTVDSVKINPSGTINLDLANGATTQLTATVAPASAANKPVKWTSSNERVAVVKNGVVQGVAKGTATITASVGGKSDTVTVNVTGEAPVVHDTTVYYPANRFGANSTYLHYRIGTGTWTTAPGVKMEAACDGYVKYTIEGTEGGQIEFVFNNGNGQWDNNGNKNYTASGANAVVENGTVGSVAPCVTVVPVSSVAISGGNFELKEGASKQLSATVAPSNATDRAVSWKSSDTSVATVDASGKVTAVKAGTATVTATAGGKSATVTVTVKGENPVVPVQSVSISGTGVSGGKATINVGAGLNLSATVSPSNATDRTVTWRSSDDSVATVSSTGSVRGLKAGTAVVTATAGGKSNSVIVTIQAAGPALQSIAITGSGVSNGKLSMPATTSRQLGYQVSPSNAVVGAVYWSSSDTSVATVDGAGKVTAKVEGVTAITVTVGNRSHAIILTVTKPIAVESVAVVGGDFTIKQGSAKTLAATVKPDDATNKSVSWSSSNNAVATVSSAGVVTALAPGKATITARCGLVSASVVVTVTAAVDSGDSLGVRRGRDMHLRNSLSGGVADVTFPYGVVSDEVFVGDWDGDGVDTFAVRRGKTFYLSNSLRGGNAEVVFEYGRAGDVILVGDWDGDGKDTFMVRRGREFHMSNSLKSGAAEKVFEYGRVDDAVVVGDWDGDGKDTLGVRRGAVMHLRNDLGAGAASDVFSYGRADDVVLSGDWDGDGKDTFMVRRGRECHVSNSLRSGAAEKVFDYGHATDMILVGNWDGK